jgi:hypothetical protein
MNTAGPTTRPWLLIVSVILIGLAIFAVYYTRTIRDISQSSRGGAQVVGLMAEANLLKHI